MACVEDGYYIEFMQEHISSLIVGDAIRLESFYSISFFVDSNEIISNSLKNSKTKIKYGGEVK